MEFGKIYHPKSHPSEASYRYHSIYHDCHMFELVSGRTIFGWVYVNGKKLYPLGGLSWVYKRFKYGQ